MICFHFLKDDMTGGYGNEPAWKEGEERTVEGELKMCRWGYHASPSWYDALGYAKGNMACIVKLSGEIQKDADKYVARTRKLVKAVNAEKALREWGCDCAERALKKAKVKDKRCWDAIKVARLFNEGEITKEELSAAGDAARDAAGATAWDAAWAAARDAAGDAAWAAWAAAWAAAWDAARDAAGDAARAAGDAAWAAAWAAARDAAGDAAWAAERRWQKRHLNKLMKELFKEG